MSRVMIASLRPSDGGVRRMTEFVCEQLERAGHTPLLAYYEPYSLSHRLSVPLHALPFRRPGVREETILGGRNGMAIGAWLPELEFTQYALSSHWRRAIESCDHHLVVSGNCLAATAMVELGTPFLGWIATPWQEDRKDRVREFPLARRLLDRAINAPQLRRLERRILATGSFLALSHYTRQRIEKLGGASALGILPMPIDTSAFTPDESQVRRGRIGFVGRLDDPRKNADLLVSAARLLRHRGLDVELFLVGCEPAGNLATSARAALDGAARAVPAASQAEVSQLLRTFDVFVVPSHQEGLCIAALEAMATGCPVVSTRCGGPEEFVIDGETGYLVEFSAQEVADRVETLISDRRLRARLGAGARSLVLRDYSIQLARQRFWDAFDLRFASASTADCRC